MQGGRDLTNWHLAPIGSAKPIEADQESPFVAFDEVEPFSLDPLVYCPNGDCHLNCGLLWRDHSGFSATGSAEPYPNGPPGHYNLPLNLGDYLYSPHRHCPLRQLRFNRLNT